MMNRNVSSNKVADGNTTYVDDAVRRVIWDALQGALSMLGESSMKAIIHHLSKRGISINNVSIKELDVALHSLFGDGSNMIMREIRKRVKKEYPELVIDEASALA
ncbi:MAG: hypothetical protein QXE95_07015 [Candidatus Nitrosocaldus sp.]